MYCPKCGSQMPADANFCMKCGTQLSGGAVPSAQKQQHWEYREFKKSLGGARVTIKYWPIGGFPEELAEPVEIAVRGLLNEIAKDGWEPAEPIAAASLWHANHLSAKNNVNRLTGSNLVTLSEVRLNCRRLV